MKRQEMLVDLLAQLDEINTYLAGIADTLCQNAAVTRMMIDEITDEDRYDYEEDEQEHLPKRKDLDISNENFEELLDQITPKVEKKYETIKAPDGSEIQIMSLEFDADTPKEEIHKIINAEMEKAKKGIIDNEIPKVEEDDDEWK